MTDELLPGAGVGTASDRCAWHELEPAGAAALGAFFRDAVLPVLTPLAIDVSRPFPLLSSLSLNLALLLEPAPGETRPRLAIVQVPAGLTRLVQLVEAAASRSCCSRTSSARTCRSSFPASRSSSPR